MCSLWVVGQALLTTEASSCTGGKQRDQKVSNIAISSNTPGRQVSKTPWLLVSVFSWSSLSGLCGSFLHLQATTHTLRGWAWWKGTRLLWFEYYDYEILWFQLVIILWLWNQKERKLASHIHTFWTETLSIVLWRLYINIPLTAPPDP